MATYGLKTIISLSFILAIGFLLVILSAALYHNYLTLLVALTFILAPLPNFISSRCASPDDFISDSGPSANAVLDFGRFATGFLVVQGVALPVSFAHCGLIGNAAAAMSVVGGVLVYGTIISFTGFFRETEDF